MLLAIPMRHQHVCALIKTEFESVRYYAHMYMYYAHTTHATCDLCPSNHYTDSEVYNWFKLCFMGIIEARLLCCAI